MSFDAFWDVYPPRQGPNPKALARKEWDKAIARGADPEEIVLAARAFRHECLKTDEFNTRFVPHARTWLHGNRWEDYIAAAPEKTYKTVDEVFRSTLPPEAQDPRWTRIRARIRSDMGEPFHKTWMANKVVFVDPAHIYCDNAATYQKLNACGVIERIREMWADEGVAAEVLVYDNIVYLDGMRESG